MSIDPRLITQLLRLQFQTSSDPLSLRNPSTDSAGDFSALLESLIGKTVAEGTAAGNRAASGLGGYSLPVSAYTSNAALQSMQRSALGPARPSLYDPLVEEASDRHNVEASLVKAVIHSESSFNPYAVSSSGAKGLMQLMDGTGEGMGVTDPFDPAQNIEGGTRYLAGLLRKYNGNEGVALAAYNAGPGRVDRLGIRTDADLKEKLHLLPLETRQYVDKVLSRKQQYG
ncbi:lytic transglycosylase domain-containing protein [Paenibacillus hemerocallicola]|uniref:Lytic transglycosylase domain-containing protein n=1 Tax=Paenibacillus hemerocallicola TaxID=1172614 RepID=A0A5C4T5Q1_9BACL|nr:lytic transglycosylase domain-containing protein [Paenibacillus hemerocallicola]TNJ64156.1 lytic transglycosylase domain-containing protein [Paenibacillus hemerocallicola]